MLPSSPVSPQGASSQEQEGKVQELRQLVQQATSAGELRARALASMHGKFVHCARVVTGVLAVTRGVGARHFRCIRQRRLWDKMLYLSARDQQDLELALQLVEQARPWPVPVGRVPWLDVRLDSSDYAMGLCILKGDQVLVAAWRCTCDGTTWMYWGTSQ